MAFTHLGGRPTDHLSLREREGPDRAAVGRVRVYGAAG
jgi:hypothetical protein